jgi:hypothetical protein
VFSSAQCSCRGRNIEEEKQSIEEPKTAAVEMDEEGEVQASTALETVDGNGLNRFRAMTVEVPDVDGRLVGIKTTSCAFSEASTPTSTPTYTPASTPGKESPVPHDRLSKAHASSPTPSYSAPHTVDLAEGVLGRREGTADIGNDDEYEAIRLGNRLEAAIVDMFHPPRDQGALPLQPSPNNGVSAGTSLCGGGRHTRADPKVAERKVRASEPL